MKKIQAEELKQIELNLLVKIDAICREHGWNYSLCGGTLLGAIRHKGFIPWDDDIDIAMPRKDYEAFLQYGIEQGSKYGINIISSKIYPSCASLAAKVCDVNTILEEKEFERAGFEIGVFVDIFPIDGLGNKEEARKRFNAKRFERELLVARSWKKFFRSKTHAWYIEPVRFSFWLLSRFVSAQKLIRKVESYYARFPLEKNEYGAVVCGAYRNKEILPTEVLNNFTEVEFEGKMFKAFKDYDIYLRSLYGDYMKLPPIEKQVSHHMFTAYWKS